MFRRSLVAPRVAVALGLAGTLSSCGSSGSGGITGQLDADILGPPAVSRRQALDGAGIDEIWAIPVTRGGFERGDLRDLIRLGVRSDGRFRFDPPDDGRDYVLAMVRSENCSEATARGDWSEAEIDRRLSCIQGYVAIPESETPGSMIAIPVSELREPCDLGLIQASPGNADEGTAQLTLAQASGCFALDLDALEELARIDDMLKVVRHHYANTSDDFSEWYAQSLDYRWGAREQLEIARGGFTDPGELLPRGHGYGFSTSVEPEDLVARFADTPRHFQVAPPGSAGTINGSLRFGPDDPMVSGGGAHRVLTARVEDDGTAGGSATVLLAGATDEGEWTIRRGGDAGSLVSKFDLAVSSPFAHVEGVLDATTPIIPVPALRLVTTGDGIDRVEVKLMLSDGTGFSDMNGPLAEATAAAPQLGVSGVGSSACPNGGTEWSSGDGGFEEGRFAWRPTGAWVLGTADETTCAVQSVTFTYRLSGAEYQFTWEGPDQSFAVTPLSGSRVAFDTTAGPTGERIGAYVGFLVASRGGAEEWAGADLWAALEDGPAGAPRQDIALGAGEDGLYHIGYEPSRPAWFYLEWTGGGSPADGGEHTVTLAVYAGRPPHPIAYRETVTLTVSAASLVTDNVVTEARVLDPTAYLGAEGRVEVSGGIDGRGGSGILLFTPASNAGWPADGVELLSTEVLFYEAGTATLAGGICSDPDCAAQANPVVDGLVAYAADPRPLDYRATYTFRWKTPGASQFLSPTLWARTASGWTHTDPRGFASLPVLPAATNATTIVLGCDGTSLSLADGSPRTRCTVSANHTISRDGILERVLVALPEGARVVPATSEQSAFDRVRAMPDPIMSGNVAEWGTSLVLPAGGLPTSTFSFTVQLPAAAGSYTLSATARIGETVIDSTVPPGDNLASAVIVDVVP